MKNEHYDTPDDLKNDEDDKKILIYRVHAVIPGNHLRRVNES